MRRRTRQVSGHLAHLVELRDHARDARERLEAVLEAYALLSHETARQHQGTELSALVHQGQHVARAQHELSQFLQDLLAEGAKTGDVRDDVAH